jgi:hypothetical protein
MTGGSSAVERPDNVEEIGRMIREIEEGLADMAARRMVENNLEKKVIDLMEKRQHQYMNELKLQIMKKKAGPENANTLKKYAELEKLEYKRLSKQGFELMRPSSTDEIIGQDRAVKALISKLATPYPQHVLIYGPPGVGKTTAARLVLEMAKKCPTLLFRRMQPLWRWMGQPCAGIHGRSPTLCWARFMTRFTRGASGIWQTAASLNLKPGWLPKPIVVYYSLTKSESWIFSCKTSC